MHEHREAADEAHGRLEFGLARGRTCTAGLSHPGLQGRHTGNGTNPVSSNNAFRQPLPQHLFDDEEPRVELGRK